MSVPSSVIVNPWLFSNYVSQAGQSPDALPIPTTNNGSNVSALIELQSTTQGFLLSRMTTAQRNALNPGNGLQIYNTTTNTLDVYINGAWNQFGVGTLQASGSITPVVWNAIQTQPVSLVPAAGAGTLLIPDILVLELVYNSVAYLLGGNVYVEYGSGAGGNGNAATGTIPNTFIQGTASASILTTGIIGGANGLANANCVNQPLYLTASTNFTTGNSTINWFLRYRVLTGL